MANIRREFGDDLTLKNGNLGINTTTAQERVDVVGVVKGQDLYATGVSSLTAYEGFLRADNQIVESTTLEFGQGLKSSLSGEIIVGTGVTVTIGIVGLGTAEVGVGSTSGADGKTASNIDTTDINLAGGSQIECLKVYNTFTPPNGGTNERPYAPKPGELYYIFDFKTIEFFDGYGWRQVDNTTRSGRAIYGGTSNNPYYQVLHYVNIHTTGNSIDFGSLLVKRYGTTGSCSSNTRAIVAGGYTPGTLDTIEYFTMASNAQAIDFGNLGQAEYCMLSCSSSTRGLFTGSYAAPSNTAQIDYVEIGTTGNALDFGDMSGVTRYGGCGLSSPTRGIFAGGRAKGTVGPYPANAGTHEIDFVTIASKGNSTTFGDMTFNGGYCGGMSNTTRGIIGGARQPATVNNIDMITIASTGNAVHFGDLTVARAGSQTGSTQTRGVFIGGSPTADTRKTIDYITISSSGNAIDFGESGFEVDIGASVSDSHGGLGGF